MFNWIKLLLSALTLLPLMHIATKWIQFSFDNKMNQRIDRIVMGSSLGVAIANILVGFQEEENYLKLLTNPFYYTQ